MKRIIFFLVCLLWLINFTYPQRLNANDVKNKISEVASSLTSMQCDFVQTKHIKLLNEKMVSNGKMYYTQSNKLRWEYVSPYKYTFILNDSKVLLRNDKHNDVIDVKNNKIFKEIARIMMNSVVGKCITNDKDFKAKISDSGNAWIASLIPQRKDMKQMFNEIIIHFNKSSNMVSRVILIEKNGDKTLIELKNIKKNENINAKIFEIQ